MPTEIDDILQLPGSGPVPIKYRKPMKAVEVFCPWCTKKVGKAIPDENIKVLLEASKYIKMHLDSIGRGDPCNMMLSTGEFIMNRPVNFREHWESYGIKVKGRRVRDV